MFFFRTGAQYFFLEPEMVINMVKQIRTEILNPVLGSFFLEYSHSDDHFAISLQKRSVFDEKLYFESLTNFKKVFFSKKNETSKKNKKIEPEIQIFFRTGGSIFLLELDFF